MAELKPCPFCGEIGTSLLEGSTYRWAVMACSHCEARAPEVRKERIGPGFCDQDEIDAREERHEWNDGVRRLLTFLPGSKCAYFHPKGVVGLSLPHEVKPTVAVEIFRLASEVAALQKERDEHACARAVLAKAPAPSDLICTACGGPVFHRPGSPGEFDHECAEAPAPKAPEEPRA